MAVIRATSEDERLLARLMRSEAEEDGKLGMLMVGNVGINRIVSDCLDFKALRSIQDMVYQSPGGFEAIQKPYFYQKARESEINLAKQTIRGWKYHPGSYSLWFFRPTGGCPSSWFNQALTGRYKAHCFFSPTYDDCPRIYW